MELPAFPADLHIHSALSPCAGREMDPPRIFARAVELGLAVLAVTDHNSAVNLPAFLADPPPGLWLVPGMELQTREEIHLICLFSSLEAAMAFSDEVYRHLPELPDPPAKNFGAQTKLDRMGKTIGEETKILLASADIGLSEAFGLVESFAGLCYPAHADRPSFGICGQLGFIPPELPVSTVEISHLLDGAAGRERFPGYQCVQSSDAHALVELGRGCSMLRIAAPVWEELEAAFLCRDGRMIEV